jgi:hypothetical protein
MRPLALALTTTLLSACATLPVTQQPAARTVTVRGEIAPRVAGYALQDLPATWTMPYDADAIATIHIALEQQPQASGAFSGNDTAVCDAQATATYPGPDYTALPVVAGSAPPLVIPGLPLGQYYRVTLQAESAASGTISCPTMSRTTFDTVGPNVPAVIPTTFPVTLFRNPKFGSNYNTWLDVAAGNVVASGTLGPSLGSVQVPSCTPDYPAVASGQINGGTGEATLWSQLRADSQAAPIYVIDGTASQNYRLAGAVFLGLKSGYFRTAGGHREASPARKVCVSLNGQSRLVDLWEYAPPPG